MKKSFQEKYQKYLVQSAVPKQTHWAIIRYLNRRDDYDLPVFPNAEHYVFLEKSLWEQAIRDLVVDGATPTSEVFSAFEVDARSIARVTPRIEVDVQIS